MNSNDPTDTPRIEPLDEFLRVLSSQYCRAALSYVRESPESAAIVDEIAEAIADRRGVETDDVLVRLHHWVLPKLEDAGVVDFERRTDTARYRGRPEVEAMLDVIADCELEGSA